MQLAKQKQHERATKQHKVFKGHALPPRSEKVAHKVVKVKKETLDEQTKAEKQYLDPELFAILQQVKMEAEEILAEQDDENANNGDKQSTPAAMLK